MPDTAQFVRARKEQQFKASANGVNGNGIKKDSRFQATHLEESSPPNRRDARQKTVKKPNPFTGRGSVLGSATFLQR